MSHGLALALGLVLGWVGASILIALARAEARHPDDP